MNAPTPIAALISGGGRTVLNLADEIDAGNLPIRISRVVAHRESLAGVARCRDRGLEVTIVPKDPAETMDDRLDEVLLESGAELICLCGYLRHFRVGERWAGRTINIHPALLPDFGGKGMYGAHVHRAVIESGRRESGCTVHFVDEEYDHGPTILQKRCVVHPDDDHETLAARVFALECDAFPEALQQVLLGMRTS
ncbi:MAG: phosphoribosylglycinamide formyltransferase [Phycisphaerales bacterium]|nr:phosphoribosylglycinamide formyltransferase [Phycisphaerales bacterium]